MKKNKVKIISILLIALSIILIGVNVYGHSGRTDSRGGHKDNQNKSGLGSYHYHCGGHPAHLHTNGVCPYSPSSQSSKSSTSSSSSSNSKQKPKTPTTIVATNIKINENEISIKEGESKKLTVTITPENVTDKNVKWKSNDENIATISSTGEIIAKKAGKVEITATSSNGKIDTIKINVREEPKLENNNIAKNNSMSNTSTMIKNNNNINNTTTEIKKDSSFLSGIIILVLLGGGTYWGYKKYRNSKVS
ncbi:MAG: Ig-like domain-containing protein [Clostridia bacterium]|nr:Ig-like domain-containing protein [Clostridium sp.]